MAVPVIAAVNSGTTAASTSHTINLPTGISAGDRLRVFLGGSNTQGTVTWPAGWTERLDLQSAASERWLAMGERVADGGEGSSIVVTTTSGAKAIAYYSERITGAHATQATEVTALTAAQGTPTLNPASITASWGAEDNLFAVAMSWYYGADGITTFPSGYGGTQEISNANPNEASLGYAALGIAADATDDPGAITFDNAGEYSACFTCVLRPAEAAAGGEESVTDVVGLGDTATGIATFSPRSVTDVVVLGDLASSALARSVTDVMELGDTVAAVLTFQARTVTDVVELGDTATSGVAASVSDGVAMGEDITTVLTMDSGPDVILLGDSAQYGAGRFLADVVNLGDAASRTGATDAGVTDVLVLGDSVARTAGRYQTDGLLLGDSTSYTGGYYTGAVTDIVLLGDTAESGARSIRFVADIALLGDSAVETPHHVRSGTDVVVLGDTVEVGTLARSLSDEIRLGDSLSAIPHYVRSISDGVLLGDSVDTESTGFFARTVSDTIMLGDLASSIEQLTLFPPHIASAPQRTWRADA